MDKHQIIASCISGAIAFTNSPQVRAYNAFLDSKREVRDGEGVIILGDGDIEKLQELWVAVLQLQMEMLGIKEE